MGGRRGETPWRLLAVLGAVLFLLVPGRVVFGRVSASHGRVQKIEAGTRRVDRRVRAAQRVDQQRLRADLQAVAGAMPTAGIEGWIDGVSNMARSTGTTWQSGTVTAPAAGSPTPGEPLGTTMTIVAEGSAVGLLAFVDQFRVAPPRLTLVDDFNLAGDPKDPRRAVATLKIRLISFVPPDPAPPVGS